MSPDALIEKIAGVIIAGGQARRMGNADKAFITLAGKPMIQYVINALRPQVGELLVNANRDLETYRSLGFPVISDRNSNQQGPLAGIAAALEASSQEWVQITPCDGPLLPSDLATRLHRQTEKAGSTVCIPHDGTRLQPLFGLFHRTLATDIHRFLDAGDRKLQLWLEHHEITIADFSDQAECFININTPEERTLAEQRLLAKR